MGTYVVMPGLDIIKFPTQALLSTYPIISLHRLSSVTEVDLCPGDFGHTDKIRTAGITNSVHQGVSIPLFCVLEVLNVCFVMALAAKLAK